MPRVVSCCCQAILSLPPLNPPPSPPIPHPPIQHPYYLKNVVETGLIEKYVPVLLRNLKSPSVLRPPSHAFPIPRSPLSSIPQKPRISEIMLSSHDPLPRYWPRAHLLPSLLAPHNSRPISAPACSPFASSPVRPLPITPCTCADGTASLAGRGLSLAPGVQVPEVIQKALESSPPAQRRPASNRESLQRKRNWWLPYIVLEFDNNQVLVDAMGGDLASPVWNYRTTLYAVPIRTLGHVLTTGLTAMCHAPQISPYLLTYVPLLPYTARKTWEMTCLWHAPR